MVDTLHPPPEVIASWPKPNYVNPVDRGPALIYLCIILSALGAIICTARVYSRLFITRAPGVDDLLIVLSLFFSIALSVLVIIANKLYHSGRHIWDVPIGTFSDHRRNIWISEWCFVAAGALIKISVLLFYRRLSVKFSKAFLIATWVGIVYNVLYLTAFGLTLLLICRPVYAYWRAFDPIWASSHKFHCSLEGTSLPASAGLSVLGDLYSTLLPVCLIYNLDLPRRQKLALYGLFALGFMSVGAGIARTVLLYKLLNSNFDFTWVLWETWIWAVLELYVAIFAASAPALKPFFRRYFLESLGSIRRKQDSAVWYQSGGAQKDTWVSDDSKVQEAVDVERIGIAHSGTPEEVRARGFLKDIGNSETRSFRMSRSADGKMIPMQFYRSSQDSDEVSISLPSPRDYDDSISRASQAWSDNWPIPPANAWAQTARHDIRSQISQQTIHVGLQLDHPMPPFNAAQGSWEMATPEHVNHSREYASGHISSLYEDRQQGLGTGSRLESPSDSDEGSAGGDTKPPWNTIHTSSSGARTERSDSDETLQLPRMGSRDFVPEKKDATRVRPTSGHAI